jgi:hypothetical protein
MKCKRSFIVVLISSCAMELKYWLPEFENVKWRQIGQYGILLIGGIAFLIRFISGKYSKRSNKMLVNASLW